VKHQVLTPAFRRLDERGLFVEGLNDGRWESLLFGSMTRGAVMGNHYHAHTDIFFCLTKGKADVTIVQVDTGEREQLTLNAEQGIRLAVRESHAIRFLEDSDFIMLKSLRYNPADPDTVAYPVDGRTAAP
jgi:dTDP-4-dehydrorhamnose 3,5-epimerase-like enzyme